MPADATTLVDQAKCIECSFPEGLRLPALVALLYKKANSNHPINLIPPGSFYFRGFFDLTPFVAAGRTYKIIFGSNENNIFNPGGAPVILTSTGPGNTQTFTVAPVLTFVGMNSINGAALPVTAQLFLL